jgi:Sulfotransferase domain
MNHFRNLFTSPEFYPLRIDFKQQRMHFVRMSPATYRESVFLDERTRSAAPGRYEMRLDDVLLAAMGAPNPAKPVHYILHPTFCCSTLLARYFEAVPACFVLKEPMLLTQLALTPEHAVSGWAGAFDLAMRLFSRTYDTGAFVVVKPHEPCNALARKLLEHNPKATITFLTAPLKHFLLAVLKADDRRNWVRRRIPGAGNSTGCPALMNIDPRDLNDAEAAAYLWLVNRLLARRLASGAHGSRVLLFDGEHLAAEPEKSLRTITRLAGLPLDGGQLKSMIEHPSASRYSKDLSRSYDASSRQRELAELEKHWGREAKIGLEWAAARATLPGLCGLTEAQKEDNRCPAS